jgi:hypothetical protein
VSGVAEYENQGGMLVPKLPTPDMCAGGGGGIPALPIVGGLAVAGLVAYLVLR